MLLLERTRESEKSTQGVLILNSGTMFQTLEPPWRNNQRQISCIPTGIYLCKPHLSERFGATWRLLNVPERDDILFHVGNFPRDTHGCILVGMTAGDNCVFSSSLGMKKFVDYMTGAGVTAFSLKICYAKALIRREEEERDGCPTQGIGDGSQAKVSQKGQKTPKAERDAAPISADEADGFIVN